jgi:hypothetical protein
MMGSDQGKMKAEECFDLLMRRLNINVVQVVLVRWVISRARSWVHLV